MTERRRKKRNESSEYKEKLTPKTEGHKGYIRCMAENTVTFCTGPAGSSKSYTALGLASQYLLEERVRRIVIARPTVEASPKGLGFLPGGINDKLSPYVQPAIEHLQRFLGRNTFHQLRGDGRICIEALEYLRGKTFDDSFIIGEEFQNATKEQIIMFVTRIGDRSRMVINGDMAQTDIRKDHCDYSTDLEYVIEKIKRSKIPEFGVVELSENDIVRNKLIGPFLRLFN